MQLSELNSPRGVYHFAKCLGLAGCIRQKHIERVTSVDEHSNNVWQFVSNGRSDSSCRIPKLIRANQVYFLHCAPPLQVDILGIRSNRLFGMWEVIDSMGSRT